MQYLRSRKIIFTVVRWTILLAVLIWVSVEFALHAFGDKVHPSVHALCPFGGLESLLRWMTAKGATLGKVFSGTMGIFFASIGISLLFKRSFCGAICPLGTLQEIPGALGRWVFRRKRIALPWKVDRILRFAKYPVLAFSIYMAWLTGRLWIQSWDPWSAYAHVFNATELFGPYFIGFIVLAISLVASFFIDRAFCKYLCPMGAFTALVGLLSPFKVRRDATACTSCLKCDRACPVNLKPSETRALLHHECISCGNCVAACPESGALTMGFPGKFRLNPTAAVALAVGTFFLVIFALQLAGFDRHSGAQEPTLREIAGSQGLSAAEFKARYGLPASLFDGTRSSAIEARIPLAKMAELNGTTAAAMKETLGLDPAMPDDTLWGKAYGAVRLERIAELNGTTVEAMKKTYGLPESVGADTSWGDVEKDVLRAVKKAQSTSSGSCAME